MTNEINAYFGTYIGFSPTDESKVAVGEMEVMIGEQGLKIRHATGLTINEEIVTLEQVRKLSEAEVRSQYKEGSDAYTRIDGFQIGGGVVLLFVREPEENDPRLIVRLSEMVEMLGITMLYDEGQIANGALDRIIGALTEQVGSYPFPRLEYGGLHEPRVG